MTGIDAVILWNLSPDGDYAYWKGDKVACISKSFLEDADLALVQQVGDLIYFPGLVVKVEQYDPSIEAYLVTRVNAVNATPPEHSHPEWN